MQLQKKTVLATLVYFVKSYPKQSFATVVALVLAGVAETLGIGALLPLITIVH